MSQTTGVTTGVPPYLVSDLVTFALLQIGVGAAGTTPASADLASGVMHLNMMLAQWQRRRWLVPSLTDTSCVSSGAISYTVGSAPAGFEIQAGRPDKLEAAYVRYLGNGVPAVDAGDFEQTDFSPTDFNTGDVTGLGEPALTPLALDYPLTLIPSREDYSSLSLKNLSTWPAVAYYSPDWPVGNLFVWPLPANGLWEIHIVFKSALPATLTLTSAVVLPPEYQDAIMWNLAARLAPSYGQQASPTIVALAKSALQTIRTANTQIPLLEMPIAIGPRLTSSVPVGYVLGGLI